MGSNPLTSLVKLYDKSVKNMDKNGFAEIYMQATELLFERLRKETSIDLHFEDVEYLDGYFIFGYGTNSVVHFHIKEAPGWLFGIWWSPVPTDETKNKNKQKYKTDRLFCEFFFQFEKEIDKFKPSASTFEKSFEVFFEEGHSSGSWIDAYRDLEFIIKEPYLAFYKEMHCTDFNHEYVSRETAKNYWNKHWKKRAERKQLMLTNAKAMFETFKYILDPIVKAGNAFIYDEGRNVYPRYEVVIKNVKLNDNKYYMAEDGCYYLFNLGYEDEKSDEKLYKKTEKECAKRGHCQYYIENPFSTCCTVVKAKRYNKWLKEAIDENAVLYYKNEEGTLVEGELLKGMDD